MSGQSPSLVRSFTVGRYTVTLRVPPIERGSVRSMVCEWEPETPTRLTKRELREYRAGRDAALAELAEAMSTRALVIEL